MNIVKIIYDPLKRFPMIYINGDHISPYSDLASCENKDLHIYAIRLLKLLDEELGSEYEIELIGSQFQIDLLNGLINQSEYCTAVRGSLQKLVFSTEEVVDFSRNLIEKYSLDVNPDITVHAVGTNLVNDQAIVVNDPDNPELYICSEAPERIERGRTLLVFSDHFDIRNTRGINGVTIPSEYVNDFLEYYQYYAKVLPLVEETFKQSNYVSLSSVEEIQRSAYTTQKAKYIFDIEKTILDVGEKTRFQFKIIPESHASSFSLAADKPNYISIKNGYLVASKDGIVSLSVVDHNNAIIETKQITISSHSYVTSIRLVSDAVALEVGKKGKIDAYLLPEGAENANTLSWSSNNPDVLHVTSAGEIVALKPGVAVICAATTSCSEYITITVLPSLERISLSKTTMTVQVDASDSIECNLFPADAAHREIIWELSNDGIGTLNTSNGGRTCTFMATTSSIAKGNIKCRIKGSEINASCAIEIVPEEKPTGLMTCALVFSIIGLIASFLIPLMWYGGRGIAGFFADFFLPVGICKRQVLFPKKRQLIFQN